MELPSRKLEDPSDNSGICPNVERDNPKNRTGSAITNPQSDRPPHQGTLVLGDAAHCDERTNVDLSTEQDKEGNGRYLVNAAGDAMSFRERAECPSFNAKASQ
jgi:hypothetical protein